jgi:hypothetical protein
MMVMLAMERIVIEVNSVFPLFPACHDETRSAEVAKQSIAVDFSKIAYFNHSSRYKLGMHELSSAERSARYRRFFVLLNNPPPPPGLYQNLFAASIILNSTQA